MGKIDQETVDQDELDEILAEKTVVLEKTLLSFKVDAKSVEIHWLCWMLILNLGQWKMLNHPL